MAKRYEDQASRRTVIRAGAAVVAGVALSGFALIGAEIATSEPTRAQAKIAQKLVQYVEVSKKPNQKCSGCVNFVAPNACKIVDGVIAPGGWCVSWAPAPKSAS